MPSTNTPEIRAKILSYSQHTEEVLLLLLQDNEDLRQKLEKEISDRQNSAEALKQKFDKETRDLADKLNAEIAKREKEVGDLKNNLEAEKLKGGEENLELKMMIEKEREERKLENGAMDTFFRRENEDRKSNLDAVNDWIRAENDKRKREAEALQARMEREKQELRDYIEKDNKAMKEKMSLEEEQRKRKEQEIKDKLKEQDQVRENEIIQLYKKMAAENAKREEEIEELRLRLQREKEELRMQMEKEQEEMKDRLNRENLELRQKLESEKKGLKGNIDDNLYDSNRRLGELATKLANLGKDADSGLRVLRDEVETERKLMRKAVWQPLSVYFNAYRTEDYLDGGEDYLTFTACHTNLGGGMDAKSGVFTAPLAGAYLFLIHVCTHDMKKALMTLRRNGRQVASAYDQNHESNHKNSMVGQSVLIELEVGDTMQVYLFTETGLQDKPNNHLTQFVGMFLRPKRFMEEMVVEQRTILSNGH